MYWLHRREYACLTHSTKCTVYTYFIDMFTNSLYIRVIHTKTVRIRGKDAEAMLLHRSTKAKTKATRTKSMVQCGADKEVTR